MPVYKLEFCTYSSLVVIFIVSAFNRSWIEFDIFSFLTYLRTLSLREEIMELAFITLSGRLVSITSIRVDPHCSFNELFIAA